jgi:putative alpha-1,2-mannosidase
MSSWYVWAALGMYPLYPGRAELVLGSPLFEEATVTRGGGALVIHAPGAAMDAPYIAALSVNGAPSTRAWLPASVAAHGGTLSFTLAKVPNKTWGAAPADAPPSFGPPAN